MPHYAVFRLFRKMSAVAVACIYYINISCRQKGKKKSPQVMRISTVSSEEEEERKKFLLNDSITEA